MKKLAQQCIFFLIVVLTARSSEVRAQDFYPLEPGNTWHYRVFYSNYPLPMDSVTYQLVARSDTLMPNGRLYVILTHPDVLGGRFVRVDSNYVYYYSSYSGSDVPAYNLRAGPGTVDTLTGMGPLFSSRVASITTQQIFGVQRTVRRYEFDGLVQYEVSLADGFGIVDALDKGDAIWPFYAWWSIRGCIIRDTLYGTVVSVPDNPQVPTRIELHQNFPNPFNPNTTISYQLPTQSHVTLNIYDVLGREVTTLVNEINPPGSYEVSWSASNVASGIYFYRLQAGDFTQTRKLVLMK